MILCCGEALIDMIPARTTLGQAGFVPHSGGAVFNTAIALGRLGIQAGMMSGVSSDMFGAQLMRELNSSGVDTSHLISSERPTTLAFVQLRDGQAQYAFFDENSAGRMLRPDDLPVVDPAVSALFMGGISLACEPAADTYLALSEREAHNKVIMLDPNIRPDFIVDEARYRARLERMIAYADIIKVSDEDLNWIIPGGSTLIVDKAMQLAAMGPFIVIVTRGAQGAMALMSGGQTLNVPSHPVDVVDTVGAGDTFNAGILAHLMAQGALNKDALRGVCAQTLTGALEFAASVAAITVSRSGANPPWRRELDN